MVNAVSNSIYCNPQSQPLWELPVITIPILPKETDLGRGNRPQTQGLLVSLLPFPIVS